MGVGGAKCEVELYIPQKSKGKLTVEGMPIYYKNRSKKGPDPIGTRSGNGMRWRGES